ncbi:MAG: hypothetical protein H8E94_02365 [Alphaproteobacteria bacterium]|nr:hypothetical protein [Alphaproteobacteria bacterium]
MDDDDLTIGKGRSSNAAIALAEEAARIQRKVSAELREMAATRAKKSDEAAKEARKDETPEQQAKADGQNKGDVGRESVATEEKTVPLAPETNTTVDIKA